MYKDKIEQEEKELKKDSQLELGKNLVEEKDIVQETSGGKEDDLKKLIEKNIKWSQIIYQQNKKIKNRLTLMVVGSYLKIFLILAPIIIAIFYLPPFINQIMKTYGGLLPSQGGSPTGIMDELNKLLLQNNVDIKQIKTNQK